MTRPVPSIAVSFVEQVEGCVLTPYVDSTGHWTDGYGNAVGVVPHGPAISQDIAASNLLMNLQIAADRLAKVVTEPAILKLTDHQYSAVLSFVFNLGCNPAWTIWKDLNAGNLADVPTQIKRFDKGVVGGKLVDIPGLDHRRLAEVVLWNGPDTTVTPTPAQSAAVVQAAVSTALAAPVPAPSSSVTRDSIVTPPTPPKPPFNLASVSAKVGGAVGGLGVVAAQVQGTIQPQVENSPVLQHAVAILGIVIVACGVIGILIHNAQAKA